jgi:hypothetical protein
MSSFVISSERNCLRIPYLILELRNEKVFDSSFRSSLYVICVNSLHRTCLAPISESACRTFRPTQYLRSHKWTWGRIFSFLSSSQHYTVTACFPFQTFICLSSPLKSSKKAMLSWFHATQSSAGLKYSGNLKLLLAFLLIMCALVESKLVFPRN